MCCEGKKGKKKEGGERFECRGPFPRSGFLRPAPFAKKALRQAEEKKEEKGGLCVGVSLGHGRERKKKKEKTEKVRDGSELFPLSPFSLSRRNHPKNL